jgi:peptide/nickel transport system substrate-binding protein
MKKLRWQILVVVLALAAIGIILYFQQPTASLPGAEPAVKPISGGKYTEGLIGAFGRLNPILDFYNPADRDIDRLIFSGLIRFDDRGAPMGDLAETWGISQDGTVYNFSIRPNAVWHDGKPVMADDVIFTIGFLRSDQAPVPPDLREFWKQVDVKALDDRTLQFRLPEAFSPFLDYLVFGVLPQHLLSGVSIDQLVNSGFNLKPVGSGPYRLERLTAENGQIKGVNLTANKEYYGRPAYVDQVSFLYYPDAAAAMAAYGKNEIMGVSQLTADVLPAALKNDKLKVYSSPLPRLDLVYINLDNPQVPFFKDQSVRKALITGLNRQAIIDRVLGGQAILANGPIFPGSWAYYPNLETNAFDPNGAINLLKKAGYVIPAQSKDVRAKDGVKLEFDLAFPDEDPYRQVAAMAQADWFRLGIKVNLKPVVYQQLLSDFLEPRTYQAALVDLNMARSPDPDPYPFWHQAQISGGQNFARWDDRQASEYLEQGRVLVDFSERARRYRNFQVRFNSEVPAIPLYYPIYSYGVDEGVQGVSMGPLYDPSDRFRNLTEWFLLSRKTGPGGGAQATPISPSK